MAPAGQLLKPPGRPVHRWQMLPSSAHPAAAGPASPSLLVIDAWWQQRLFHGPEPEAADMFQLSATLMWAHAGPLVLSC